MRRVVEKNNSLKLEKRVVLKLRIDREKGQRVCFGFSLFAEKIPRA